MEALQATDIVSRVLSYAVVIGTLIVGTIGGWIIAARRRKAMSAYAATRKWTFTAKDDSWCHVFSSPPFGRGHSRHATDVITGLRNGHQLVAFDYEYTTGSGKSAHTHHNTVVGVLIGGDGPPLPQLQVGPGGLLGFVEGGMLPRVQLESEAFNHAFTVTCPDPKFASDVLHPRLMETLLAKYRDMAWHFDGRWIVSVHDRRFQPAAIDHALECMDTVVNGIPEFVREDHGLPDALA